MVKIGNKIVKINLANKEYKKILNFIHKIVRNRNNKDYTPNSNYKAIKKERRRYKVSNLKTNRTLNNKNENNKKMNKKIWCRKSNRKKRKKEQKHSRF